MIQILSCFSKTLYFDVQRFDKKLRGQSERYPLILNQEDGLILGGCLVII